MSNVSPEKKDSIMKSLAIAGFISIVVLIAWLSIQVVQLIPNAFSSLASLAESVNQYQQSIIDTDGVVPITVTSDQTIINAGDNVTLSWDSANVAGSYTFSYACEDGVAVDLISNDGVRSINCESNYNIGDTTSLSLKIDSEKNRYAELAYTVAFLRTNDTEPRASGTASVTVVNTVIADGIVTNPEEVAVATTTPVTEEEETTTPEPESPVVVTPPVTTPPARPTTPTYTQEYTYAIPVSNPNGRTDLSTRFLNIGVISNNTFITKAITQSAAGAIQFEVKNIGTKTSGTWTYSVTLPDGTTYTSGNQKALRPNERAVLSIGFSAPQKSSHTFVVNVKESTDITTINNRFSQTITFVK